MVGAVVGLTGFGVMADAYDEFAGGAMALFMPAAAASVLFTMVPETKDRELEDWQAD